jgi:hypothetical protein
MVASPALRAALNNVGTWDFDVFKTHEHSDVREDPHPSMSLSNAKLGPSSRPYSRM